MQAGRAFAKVASPLSIRRLAPTWGHAIVGATSARLAAVACCRCIVLIGRGLLVALLSALLALGASVTNAQAAVRSCPAFTIHGTAITLRATNVRRTSRISCRKARKLLAGAYGRGAIKTVYPKPSGRPTYWLPGGWRCGNGAGGAGCRSANDHRFNEVDNHIAVAANTAPCFEPCQPGQGGPPPPVSVVPRDGAGAAFDHRRRARFRL